jgi:hypothetical protein
VRRTQTGKIRDQLSEYDSNQDLVSARPACQPFASPTLFLAGTGKIENQIGFII